VVKNLLALFFKNRHQYVTINSCNSSKININYGVPLGSVLGPLLFLLYVNDLPSCTASSLKLFANDTCLIVTGNIPLKILSVKSSKIWKTSLVV